MKHLKLESFYDKAFQAVLIACRDTGIYLPVGQMQLLCSCHNEPTLFLSFSFFFSPLWVLAGDFLAPNKHAGAGRKGAAEAVDAH